MVSDPLQLETQVRCGVIASGEGREPLLKLARRVEEAGLDSLWVGDHVSFYVPIMESLSLLSFLAAATERVRLGTSVYLMPLRHPTITAKMTSTLDVLSGGRLALGVGVGGEFPPEFQATGVDLSERGSRTDEGIEILRKLWREDAVTHAGRHFQFGPISINPKPIQEGGPRVLVGGRKPPAIRRAGRLGDGYISHMCSPEMYSAHLEQIRKHASQVGRKNVAFETLTFIFTLLDQNYEAALDRAGTMLGTIYNRPFHDAAKKYCLLGKPEDCLEQMRAFAKAGSRHFILAPLSDAFEFVERVEKQILPELRQISV